MVHRDASRQRVVAIGDPVRERGPAPGTRVRERPRTSACGIEIRFCGSEPCRESACTPRRVSRAAFFAAVSAVSAAFRLRLAAALCGAEGISQFYLNVGASRRVRPFCIAANFSAFARRPLHRPSPRVARRPSREHQWKRSPASLPRSLFRLQQRSAVGQLRCKRTTSVASPSGCTNSKSFGSSRRVKPVNSAVAV